MLYLVVTSGINHDDMPIIRNPRWERFARELAGGKTAGQAYEIAGFSPNPANAWRLRKKEVIGRRIDEILTREERATDKAMASAAERAGLNEEWVLRNLRVNAVMAMRHGDRAAAARSLELIGRHLSMFVDRKSVEINVADDSDEYLSRILEVVQGRVVDNEPVALPAVNGGLNAGSDSQAADDTIEEIR
jgi:hypothetical protein